MQIKEKVRKNRQKLLQKNNEAEINMDELIKEE